MLNVLNIFKISKSDKQEINFPVSALLEMCSSLTDSLITSDFDDFCFAFL